MISLEPADELQQHEVPEEPALLISKEVRGPKDEIDLTEYDQENAKKLVTV